MDFQFNLLLHVADKYSKFLMDSEFNLLHHCVPVVLGHVKLHVLRRHLQCFFGDNFDIGNYLEFQRVP